MKPKHNILIFCVALLTLSWLLAELSLALLGDHKITEGIQLKKKDVATFSLTSSSALQQIYLSGTMDIGIVTEFKNLLIKHPNTTGLVLESKGGNIYQARGLANVVIEYGLNTFAFNHCYSACTIVFIAGKNRYIGEQAELGFHGYSLEQNLTGSSISIEDEQSKDLLFFAKQIPDHTFVQNIFRRESHELWVPDSSELLKAGVVHKILP